MSPVEWGGENPHDDEVSEDFRLLVAGVCFALCVICVLAAIIGAAVGVKL